MEELKVLFMVAFLVEAIWQALKPLWPRKLKELEVAGGIPVDSIGCLALSLLFCIGTRVNLLAMVGIDIVIPYIGPYIGMVLTAFIVYRGGNFLHDVLGKINDIRSLYKPLTWADGERGPEEEPDLYIGHNDEVV